MYDYSCSSTINKKVSVGCHLLYTLALARVAINAPQENNKVRLGISWDEGNNQVFLANDPEAWKVSSLLLHIVVQQTACAVTFSLLCYLFLVVFLVALLVMNSSSLHQVHCMDGSIHVPDEI